MSRTCDLSLVNLAGVTKPKDWVPNGILLFQVISCTIHSNPLVSSTEIHTKNGAVDSAEPISSARKTTVQPWSNTV